MTNACSSTPTSGAHGIEGTITLNTSATPDDYEDGDFDESDGVPFPYAKFSVASSDGTSVNCTGYADKTATTPSTFPMPALYHSL